MSSPLHLRPRRRLAAALAVVVVSTAVAGCSDDVAGTARVDASAVGAYRAEMSSSSVASAERERSDADYAVCSAATSAAGSMLAAYNRFVASLNATQDYGALRGVDLTAVAALDRGAGDIRGAVRPAAGDTVRGAATALADRAAALAGVVRAKGRAELNAASSGFLQARDGILSACRSFLSPAPSAAGGSSQPAPSVTPSAAPR